MKLVLGVIIAGTMMAGCAQNGTGSEQEETQAAADYPKKEIELTCPYSPGGGSDVFARTFAEMASSVGRCV